MQSNEILIAAAGMAAVTISIRLIPFAVKPKKAMSPLVASWVRYLPVSVLAAVVVPAILLSRGENLWGPISLPFLASLPTLLMGIVTRSLIASVGIGVASIALLRGLF